MINFFVQDKRRKRTDEICKTGKGGPSLVSLNNEQASQTSVGTANTS